MKVPEMHGKDSIKSKRHHDSSTQFIRSKCRISNGESAHIQVACKAHINYLTLFDCLRLCSRPRANRSFH